MSTKQEVSAMSEFWDIRGQALQAAFEKNGFAFWQVNDVVAAKNLILDTIVPLLAPKVISFAGSTTVEQLGILDSLFADSRYSFIKTNEAVAPEEKYERRRQALLCDLMIMSANAITLDGKLVSLDAYGNRTAALQFGPKNVLVVAGRNKVCVKVEDAMARIKEKVAPVNAIRLNTETPCTVTGKCSDCKSPGRICSYWAIAEKCKPAKRIHVLYVDEELGF